MGIQTVARQLIGKGDIYMGRKAKKFTKIDANLNVRFGSLADLLTSPRHVRYSPQSGHSSARFAHPQSADSGTTQLSLIYDAKLSLFLELALVVRSRREGRHGRNPGRKQGLPEQASARRALRLG
jgi:hypothetical protein